ncbi:MAG TPA: Fic family protein [Ectothiorhodospiraceae bacterium]|nr:Fic family protein [Ectothiorhodospiraceae bacterium]
MTNTPIWQPNYTITPATASGLMEIEAARAVLAQVTLPVAVQAELRRRARLRSTHYSTRIEGNRLTLQEAQEVIDERRTTFHGRERDVAEVRNYWNALLRVEEWAAEKTPMTKKLIQRLHALIEHGVRARPTPYRDGQNVIRDSASGKIVYMPPVAKDVPHLMAAMVNWDNKAEEEGLPAPLIAAIVHYQFATIHPYYDGNGRTARLLATFTLHRGGYGLNGLLSLEEYHARDLDKYYHALAVHPHHNYYFGRGAADISSWVEYFIGTLAAVFTTVRDEVLRSKGDTTAAALAEPDALRCLDQRARTVLALFLRTDRITTADVAGALGLSDRMARVLLGRWVEDGWLEVADPSRRARAYLLSASYRQFIGSLSAMGGE